MAEEIAAYTPPEMLNDTDVEVIHARMMGDLPLNIDQTEGGFAWDMTRPSAIEKQSAMEAVNLVAQMIFPEWAEGEILDLHARRSNITRRAATHASGILHVQGTMESLIPRGFMFSVPATPITPNKNYYVTEDITLSEGDTPGLYEADVQIRAADEGQEGNTPANSIILMGSAISGITSVTNPSALSDGADEETDDELRQRIIEVERSHSFSNIGNNADYKRWAMEVDGVGTAAVIPEWRGTGTGTVKVVILTQAGGQASDQLLSDVYDHIMGSEENPETRLAPVGAILTVSTATPMPITISASVELDTDVEAETAEESLKESLKAYFMEAKEDGEIRYQRVARCLSQTPGVIDYKNLLINSDTENIDVDLEDLPVVSTVTLTEAEV